MKTLGLIGGTSWHSTLVYYELINRGVGEILGHHLNPPLILYSLDITVMREGDKEQINQTYLKTARALEKAGAEAIIICANTPHMVYEFVQPQIQIPILHIAESIGNTAKDQGLKKLGLLGNRPTMTGNFIPSYLREHFDIETLIPDSVYIDKSHHYISKELTQGIFGSEAKAFYMDQILRLQKKGSEGIILGCTELPILLSQEDVHIPLIPTTQMHAQAAVDFIVSKNA